jgi:hypothetical protein
MPLGRVIAATVADVRDRVEVSGHGDTWQVTAGSFETALAYVDSRFDDAVVLARRDHGRRWPRVTLEVSTDPALAAGAPPLSELAHPPQPPAPPPPPAHRAEPVAPAPEPERGESLPSALEAIFAHQNQGQRRR